MDDEEFAEDGKDRRPIGRARLDPSGAGVCSLAIFISHLIAVTSHRKSAYVDTGHHQLDAST